MGRPTKLTARVQQTICEHLADGASLAAAAEMAGIHPATMGRWMQRGEDETAEPYCGFRQAVSRARAGYEQDLINQILLFARADQPQSWRAAIELLKVQFPDRYGDARIQRVVERKITEVLLERARKCLPQEHYTALLDELTGDDFPSGERAALEDAH
jgi:transposase